MRNRTVLSVLLAGALMAWLAAPVSAQKVVKIGDLGSKVGVFEGYGKYQTMAIQMAVEELNAKGGVLGHKIEIISEDDETKPAPAVRKAETQSGAWDYIYEPSAQELLDGMMRRYIESVVYQMVAENMGSEQSARMVAMKAASDNANKIISELQLIYNKTRQAAITKELSEIVGGAAAV